MFRAGRVIVASIDNGQGKKVVVGDPGKHGYIDQPLVVAMTPGGVDALIEALRDAKAELWKA